MDYLFGDVSLQIHCTINSCFEKFRHFRYSIWTVLRIRPTPIVVIHCLLVLISGNGNVSHNAYNSKAHQLVRVNDVRPSLTPVFCRYRVVSLIAPPARISWRLVSCTTKCILKRQQFVNRRRQRNRCVSITLWTSSAPSPTMWAY